MEDDGDDKDDSKRKTRNLSEKKRRDQFNMLVNELGAMVSTNNRKMDKSTVLKSTISFLKNHNEVTIRSRAHDVQEDWKPAFLSNEEFTYLVLEALEGFVMVFSSSGCIHYVSESILSLLGLNPNNVVNKSIFELAHEEDHSNLYNILNNRSSPVRPNQTMSSDNEIRFHCHLKRGATAYHDEAMFELVQFNGHFRLNMEHSDTNDSPYQHDRDSRVLFVCTGKLCTPQLIRDVSLVDSSRNEFTSRHSLEWKFLFLDHRAPPIIGYLPFEVLGTSGYDYYHFDDLEKVVTCHEALMQKGEMTSCYYRFLTKGQQWIWLQTRFYITYHQWNSKPEFVVCTHRVVSSLDIERSAKRESEPEPPRAEPPETSSEDAAMALSPSYMSEPTDRFGTCRSLSQVSAEGSLTGTRHAPASVTSVATSASSACATAATGGSASWPPRASAVHFATGSDTTSLSEDSHSSQRVPSQEARRAAPAPAAVPAPASALVPQHGIGAQYLEPAPYVSGVSGASGAAGAMPLPAGPALPAMPLQPLPLLVTQDNAQLQEQLQRTHRELHQMIMRQQEELRQVKEQLLLARLGILQPIINVEDAYVQPEEMQNQRVPTRAVSAYDAQAPAAAGEGAYPHPHPHPHPQQHPQHQNQHHHQQQQHRQQHHHHHQQQQPQPHPQPQTQAPPPPSQQQQQQQHPHVHPHPQTHMAAQHPNQPHMPRQ